MQRSADSGGVWGISLPSPKGCPTACWCKYGVHGAIPLKTFNGDNKSNEKSHCDRSVRARNGTGCHPRRIVFWHRRVEKGK